MFEPNRSFQSGMDPESVRRQRQKASLSLRREDRAAKLQTKRQRVLQRVSSHSSKGPEGEHQQMLLNLPKFVAGCFTEHKSTIFECTQSIRELLSFAKSAPIAQVVDSGVVSRIIQFLRWTECPELQFEAMWVLTNIASSDRPEFTAKVVRDGAIPAVIAILKAPSYRLLEQAVWALGRCIAISFCLMLSEHIKSRLDSIQGTSPETVWSSETW